jgi:5'-nucleotidase
MKFLLTNDDGIDAPGLRALLEAAAPLGESLLAAPAEHLSGCSHQVTTGRPIRVEGRGEGRFAVFGTPADCVRVGLHGLAAGAAWVLSGVNAGGNLGADIHHSGTVAAVREAVLHGVPGVAVSHYIRRGREVDWVRAAGWLGPLLRRLLAEPWAPGTFWNVNLPHPEAGDGLPEVVLCEVDPAPLPLSFRREGDVFHYNGDYHQRARARGTDVDVCFSGRIAVSKVRLF